MNHPDTVTLPTARDASFVRYKPRAAMAMRPPALAKDLFGTVQEELSACVDLHPDVLTELTDATSAEALRDVEVLITGWGCPRITPAVLDHSHQLKAVIHTGGSATAVIDASLAAQRNIALSNAGEANAIPVAEFTFAQILLANKQAVTAERLYRSRRAFVDRERDLRNTGNYHRRIGLVGASRIGRHVARMLQMTDLQVLFYDPYLQAPEAAALGGTKVSLETLFEQCDVVSLHAPVTPETENLVGRDLLRRMPDGATLINTARGALVDHPALMTELQAGRIFAVLDVTSPEPLPPTHPLWSLPNVTLTPHIAGSTGNELQRLGRQVVDELQRLATGKSLAFAE